MSQAPELNPLGLAVRRMADREGITIEMIAKRIGCAVDTLHRVKKDGYEQTMRYELRKGIEKVFGKEIADWFRQPTPRRTP